MQYELAGLVQSAHVNLYFYWLCVRFAAVFLINLLPAWLRTEGVDLKAIGLFALIQLPYTWKFIWSPLMDRFSLPLGRRRGWMLATQVGLIASLAGFAAFQPQQDIWSIAVLAVAVAFLAPAKILCWMPIGVKFCPMLNWG